ncbi:c-type cytochrome [Parasphingopyxis lamellibrachiae]|uniref:Mono/diheme cytochrome c family protein n=1 Tax=Parasphingopyxis lamellibrachiae TaxID=680125 RepID=A0A3D9FD75_9SPHN|nr:c-type cytochrome [Parasphingopyxis lamellibrachiae]RED15729.1 mono/diheme cytochrome c family protein [Parasphingopyxis lamellibrachiae]
MAKTHLLFSLPLLLASCASMDGTQAVGSESPDQPVIQADTSPAAMRGAAFAQSHCSQCHSIEDGFSPRPESPSFAQIVNTPGLTDETLNYWLENSHNFPEIMDFTIAPEQIDDLAQYMLTLKDEDYQPPVQ